MSSIHHSNPSPNDRILQHLGEKKLGQLSPGEMRKVIDSLGPQEDLYTGIRYLRLVLAREGVKGVIHFVEKAHKILDNEGKLLEYDFAEFGPNHPRYYKKSPINLRNRREFLNTLGWGIPGAIAIATGIAQTGDAVCGLVKKKFSELPAPEQETMFARIHHWIEKYPLGPSEILIGAALLNESVEKWKEYKLEQVANAVAEMADLMEQQKQSSAIAR